MNEMRCESKPAASGDTSEGESRSYSPTSTFA